MKSKENLKRENEMLKRLLKDGFFWMNFSSTDCDGCCRYSAKKYTSLQEFYDLLEMAIECAEGSFTCELAPELEDGTYDLNETWSGGSW